MSLLVLPEVKGATSPARTMQTVEGCALPHQKPFSSLLPAPLPHFLSSSQKCFPASLLGLSVWEAGEAPEQDQGNLP